MPTKSIATTKDKQKNGVTSADEGLGGHGAPKEDWASLEDINNPQAAWPRAVNRVVAAACKDKTADEIFRQIGEELGQMGVSSVFLTREPAGENLLISNVTVSSGGWQCIRLKPCEERNPALSRPRVRPSAAYFHAETRC